MVIYMHQIEYRYIEWVNYGPRGTGEHGTGLKKLSTFTPGYSGFWTYPSPPLLDPSIVVIVQENV